MRETAKGESKPFVVGHSPAISGDEVYRLITPAIDLMPHQPITARQVFPGQLRDLLFANEIDVALRRGVESSANLVSAVFAYHELRIAVVADHPLAHRNSVSVSTSSIRPLSCGHPSDGPSTQTFSYRFAAVAVSNQL